MTTFLKKHFHKTLSLVAIIAMVIPMLVSAQTLSINRGNILRPTGGGSSDNIYTASGTLTGNREVDIDGNQMRIGGLLNTTGSVNWGISDPFGQGHDVLVNGFVSETKGGIEYSSASAVGDLSGIGITDFGRINALQNDTNDARMFEIWSNDDGFGNNSPAFARQIFNDDESRFNFFNQNSEETSFGRGGVDGADDVGSNFTMNDTRARVRFDRDLANGTTQQGEIEARKDYTWIKSQFTDASDDDYRAIVEARHNDGSGMKASLLLETDISSSTTVLNELTLSETGISLATLPAFDDDTDASSLDTGDFYQTTGSGASPLNVAGIIMIKQ